jgi:hypothetical protein
MKKYFVFLFALSASHLFAGSVATTLYASENEILSVSISTRGTALSFPAQPSKVVINSQFKKEIVGTDLILIPLFSTSTGTAFVYVLGSRYVLRLSTSTTAPALIVFRDIEEKRFNELLSKKKLKVGK